MTNLAAGALGHVQLVTVNGHVHADVAGAAVRGASPPAYNLVTSKVFMSIADTYRPVTNTLPEL